MSTNRISTPTAVCAVCTLIVGSGLLCIAIFFAQGAMGAVMLGTGGALMPASVIIALVSAKSRRH
ncbi:MAG: hypothetical protein AAF586_10900 [Planctomycetota bacterium]